MRMVLEIGNRYPSITGSASDEFANELHSASATPGVTELVLDLAGTKTISSMAIGSLFSTYRRLKDENKAVRVLNASPRVVNLLRMVNLADLLDE